MGMRLFIAVDFKELREFFENLQKQIPNEIAKFKLTNSYHLTLKFFGEVEDNKVDLIKENLKKIKIGLSSVTLDKIGFFPSEDYINVVWVGFRDNKGIINLQQQVDSSLKESFKKDNGFYPHITLARVKFVKDKEKFVETLKNIKVEEKTFEIKNIKLIKSTLKPEGPVYEDLGVFS